MPLRAQINTICRRRHWLRTAAARGVLSLSEPIATAPAEWSRLLAKLKDEDDVLVGVGATGDSSVGRSSSGGSSFDEAIGALMAHSNEASRAHGRVVSLADDAAVASGLHDRSSTGRVAPTRAKELEAHARDSAMCEDAWPSRLRAG